VMDNLVGIFSDVHCNIDALESMFADEPSVGTWICAGDSVGLFPCVNETIDVLRKKRIVSVQGDHEESLLSREELRHSFSGNQSLRLQEKVITKENYDYIKNLPLRARVSISGSNFWIIHDLNESSGDKYLFDFEGISERLSPEIEFVIFGNTHVPTYYKGRTTTFINPGSLGFPIQSKGKPSYALLDLNDQSLQFKRIDVSQGKVLKCLRESKYNPKFIEYLEKGYSW